MGAETEFGSLRESGRGAEPMAGPIGGPPLSGDFGVKFTMEAGEIYIYICVILKHCNWISTINGGVNGDIIWVS